MKDFQHVVVCHFIMQLYYCKKLAETKQKKSLQYHSCLTDIGSGTHGGFGVMGVRQMTATACTRYKARNSAE